MLQKGGGSLYGYVHYFCKVQATENDPIIVVMCQICLLQWFGIMRHLCALPDQSLTYYRIQFGLICFLLAVVSVLGYSFLHKMLISFNHAVELIHMRVKIK